MGVVVPHKAIDIVANAKDPKKAILDFIGDLSDVYVLSNRVLVATYMRPEKTKGGIIRPDANKEEDVWQGKVGLVLKWGTDAFKDDAEYHFADEDKAQVGEWAVYQVVNATSLMVKGFPCRLLRDASIMMKVDDPDSIL